MTRRESTDVAILGGGVIGLSIAYVLATEGVTCTILERGDLGREASWAGAGIISPGSEKPSKLPTTQLRTLSAQLHDEWAARLLEETGIDNGYRVTGGVDVAMDDREAADLASMAGRWREEGISHERLVPSEFPRVEPSLGPSVRLAYFLPDRAQIRNPPSSAAARRCVSDPWSGIARARAGRAVRHRRRSDHRRANLVGNAQVRAGRHCGGRMDGWIARTPRGDASHDADPGPDRALRPGASPNPEDHRARHALPRPARRWPHPRGIHRGRGRVRPLHDDDRRSKPD